MRINLEDIPQADIVIIQRDFPSHVEEYHTVIDQAKTHNKTVVYELDDLLLELPEKHPDFYHYITARSSILDAIVDADAIIGSTPAICEYFKTYNSSVFHFYNYLDDQIWKLPSPSHSNGENLFIGYMGGHSHAYDFETIVPAIESILNKFGEKVALRFWGLAPPERLREHPNTEWFQPGLVDYAEFAQYFTSQKCDLFIAPLVNNPFNRCKSFIKYLEYSAMGKPGIYSRITPYESVVNHGENGLLASTSEEWEHMIIQLIEDRDLRRKSEKTHRLKYVRIGCLVSTPENGANF